MRTKRKMLARLTMASAIPARLTGLRSSMRNPCLASGSWGETCSVSMLDLSRLGFRFRRSFRFDYFGCRAGAFNQRRCIQAMLFAIVVQRHFAIPPRPIHGVDVWVEEYLIKVPYQNRESGQHRFIKMNRGRNIEPPARQMIPHDHFG